MIAFVDFFNSIPIVFRAPILLNLLLLLWGINIYVFQKIHIDVFFLLSGENGRSVSHAEDANSHKNRFTSTLDHLPPRNYQRILFGVVMNFGLLGGTLYLYHREYESMEASLLFPLFLYSLYAAYFFYPSRSNALFSRTFYQSIFPKPPKVQFGEVIFCDILTSISKVLGDILISAFLFVTILSELYLRHGQVKAQVPVQIALFEEEPQLSRDYTDIMRESRYYQYITILRPFLMSLPFLMRLRQCIFMYKVEKRKGNSTQATLNVLNAWKYFSSLPVIWLSLVFQLYEENQITLDLKVLWILAVTLNSIYSFMWDVVMDWGLCQSNSKNFLLREDTLFSFHLDSGKAFSSPWLSHVIYYLVIAIDFFLRILWSFKLSVHLDLSSEGKTFLLEFCEIFRRFLWIFFRIEWEYIKITRFAEDRVVDNTATVKTSNILRDSDLAGIRNSDALYRSRSVI